MNAEEFHRMLSLSREYALAYAEQKDAPLGVSGALELVEMAKQAESLGYELDEAKKTILEAMSHPETNLTTVYGHEKDWVKRGRKLLARLDDAQLETFLPSEKPEAYSVFVRASLAPARRQARLLSERAELLAALEICLAAITDPRIGTVNYMEGSDIYADFAKAATKARAALKQARQP